jgi:hypothetical protein
MLSKPPCVLRLQSTQFWRYQVVVEKLRRASAHLKHAHTIDALTTPLGNPRNNKNVQLLAGTFILFLYYCALSMSGPRVKARCVSFLVKDSYDITPANKSHANSKPPNVKAFLTWRREDRSIEIDCYKYEFNILRLECRRSRNLDLPRSACNTT